MSSPTPEQYESALALAEESGIGVERALVAVQSPAIAEVQQAQFDAAWFTPERFAAAEAAAAEMNRAFQRMAEQLTSTLVPIFKRFMEIPGVMDAVKREGRRKRHTSWQARNYRRRR